jgi:glycosyltransferase involved in cell wall biosynthesis
MKIAVYTITKNEEKFIRRWYESVKHADYILIADTGSTDNTVKIAKELGINVFNISINPWRFDDARNASLALLPNDIDMCLCLDIDEVLSENWRNEIDSLPSDVTKIRYNYIWKLNEDGSPAVKFKNARFHARNGYRWKYATHEVPVSYGIQEIEYDTGIEVFHLTDWNKVRPVDFTNLKISKEDYPLDSRASYYYARELFFNNMFEESSKEFQRYLTLSNWSSEKCWAMRYLSKCEPNNAVEWLLKAINECPYKREPIVDLSEHYYKNGDWVNSKKYAQMALDIETPSYEFLYESECWTWKPLDLLAISEYKLGNKDLAVIYGEEALSHNPSDQRLIDNLAFYREMV